MSADAYVDDAVLIVFVQGIIRVPAGYGLSALRLCVWLFDNGCIELFYMNQGLLLTFRTE